MKESLLVQSKTNSMINVVIFKKEWLMSLFFEFVRQVIGLNQGYV